MKVEYRNIEILVPYARNARTHSDEQISQVAASIKEFGFNDPIAADGENGIIEGHARVLAAKQLGMETVPVIELSHLSDVQKRAYILAHNKLTENAGWDQELLAVEMEDLISAGFGELTGFDINEFGDETGFTDPDFVPEEPEEPVTRAGDVWLLGKHRVMCGDATSADDVSALLDGVEPHLMVTDPPYGVDYDADWRNKAKRPDGTPYGASAIGKVQGDNNADWSEAWALFPGGIVYVWHACSVAADVANSLRLNGFEIRSQIIWAKNSLVISRGHYHMQHEPCWYAVRKGQSAHWKGGRKQTTLFKNIHELTREDEQVFIRWDLSAQHILAISGDESTIWEIPKPQKSETGHSTQKPVECMARPIRNHKSKDVYDPFLGSGSTLIAAEKTNRVCYGMEIDPKYVDVIVTRWQDFTRKDAKLEATHKTFNKLKYGTQKNTI